MQLCWVNGNGLKGNTLTWVAECCESFLTLTNGIYPPDFSRRGHFIIIYHTVWYMIWYWYTKDMGTLLIHKLTLICHDKFALLILIFLCIYVLYMLFGCCLYVVCMFCLCCLYVISMCCVCCMFKKKNLNYFAYVYQ